MNNRIVNARVIVDDEVAEAGHVKQDRRELSGNDSGIMQDSKDRLVVVRNRQFLDGDDAPSNIEADLDAHLQAALDGPALARRRHVISRRARLRALTL